MKTEDAKPCEHRFIELVVAHCDDGAVSWFRCQACKQQMGPKQEQNVDPPGIIVSRLPPLNG